MNENLNHKASEVNSSIHMCVDRNISYTDHTNSFQPENHLNKSKLLLNRYGTIVLANSLSNFHSENYWWYHGSKNTDYLLQENFTKKSKSCSQLSYKESHKSVSNFLRPLFLNYTDFGNEKSVLLDQSTLSMLTYKLGLDIFQILNTLDQRILIH